MSPTPPYSLHIQTAPHRLVERATKATAPNIAKAAELKAVIEATPRGPSQERRAARLALKQERARVVAELNEARKAARAALDAASAPSGPRDDGKPTARGAARQALIVARLSIELARNAFATDKPEERGHTHSVLEFRRADPAEDEGRDCRAGRGRDRRDDPGHQRLPRLPNPGGYGAPGVPP